MPVQQDNPTCFLGLSHPGVYEPTDTAAGIAANAWEIDCSMGADLTCPGFDDPGFEIGVDCRPEFRLLNRMTKCLSGKKVEYVQCILHGPLSHYTYL